MKAIYKQCCWLFPFLLIAFSACEKKIEPSTARDISARIDSTGYCGFLIKIKTSGAEYHAVNIPLDYQTDSLNIVISYHELTDKYQCGSILVKPLTQIYIDAIRKN